MKRKFFMKTSFTAAFVLVLVTSQCHKADELSPGEVIQKLLESFNRLPGFAFKTDMGKCMVQTDADGRYRIIFKESTFTTDWSTIVKMFYHQPFRSDKQEHAFIELNDAQVEELVFLYGPKEESLFLESMKGFRIHREFPGEKMNKTGVADFRITGIDAFLQDGFFKELDISSILKDSKRAQSPKPIKIGDRKKEDISTIDLENLKIEVSGVTKISGNIHELAVKMVFEKLRSSNKNESQSVWQYMVEKDAQKPNLNEIRHKKEAIFDFSFEAGNTNMGIKVDGLPLGAGDVERSSFSVFFKPDAAGDCFELGYKFAMKNAKLSNPLFKAFESLASIKDLQVTFLLDRLSDRATMALIDYVKTTMEMIEVPVTPDLEQRMMGHMMAFLFGVVQSRQTQMKYSGYIDHHFGKVSVDAIARQFIPPVAKLSITFNKIDEILKKLAGSGLLPQSTFKRITRAVEKYTVRQKNGDAVMTWELKASHPCNYFFNGTLRELKLLTQKSGLFTWNL